MNSACICEKEGEILAKTWRATELQVSSVGGDVVNSVGEKGTGVALDNDSHSGGEGGARDVNIA